MNSQKNLLNQIKLEENNIRRQELEFYRSKEYFNQSSKNHHFLVLAAVLVPGLLIFRKLTKRLPFPRSRLKSFAKFIFYTGLKKSLRKFF